MKSTREALREAEEQAAVLFHEIERAALIKPGKSEVALNSEIFKLAHQLFGIEKYWHKRIVRAGRNTLAPYHENPPNLIIQEDDILFFDFGPIFEEWEADFGRTYVIGNDPLKIQLKKDVEHGWHEARRWYELQASVTGAEFYTYCVSMAKAYGWTFGGEIAGHIIGHFPHEKLEKENKDNYVHPLNHRDMKAPSQNGEPRTWILEIHLVDKTREIGGFFEQILY